MSTRRWRAGGATAGLVWLLATAAGCGSGDATPVVVPPVGAVAPAAAPATWSRLTVDADVLATGPGPLLAASPTLTTDATVTEVRTGEARVGTAPDLDGVAAAFGRGTGVAALAVLPREPGALDPGSRRFRLGADVLADPGTGGDDPGANVVQRGLYDGGAQFKLQLDDGVPSCRVAGDSGEVLVEGDPLLTGRWYRLLCDRDRARVTLHVAELEDAGPTGWRSWTATGATGALSFDETAGPLAVGAKLNAAGEVVADAPDAFHGLVDHVVFEMEP